MKQNFAKPIVFLSHSKLDKEFINKICNDFKRCHIEPWVDTEKIRPGESWLDAIFVDGISNCDCVLVYLTKNSINSPMVKKEINAGLLQQLNDNKVCILPCVSENSLINELRTDIRGIQCLTLNEENYEFELPRIVAEIWSSFLARTMNKDTNKQHFGGLEKVFPHAIGHDWLENIKKSTNIIIAKLKINFTDNPIYFQELKNILLKKGGVTLIMADPRSPAMWLRYMEEPSGADTGNLSETVWQQGLEELSDILNRFNIWRENLIKENIPVDKLSIGVFPHYPTHAYYKFDDDLYVFHYPFRKRGFHGPLFKYSDPETDVYKFINDSLNEVITSSIKIEDVIDEIKYMNSEGKFSDNEVCKCKIDIKPK